ncbi:hypothetical protein LIER_33682 [Lithospermum erythrorhizon]|uniref:Uncharacterized protein n=1 Tax=Lithospermum erythrorhizon TaxID=34254 RepID=A0AAV3S152_LITER
MGEFEGHRYVIINGMTWDETILEKRNKGVEMRFESIDHDLGSELLFGVTKTNRSKFRNGFRVIFFGHESDEVLFVSFRMAPPFKKSKVNFVSSSPTTLQ